MISSKEEDSLMFMQYVEDCGLRAYNRLVTHNIDQVWNEKSKINFQEKNDKKRKQEEAIKRGEEVVTEGKHLRMGSMSMPAPAEHMSPHQHQHPCNPGFSVRSQSLHSVGGLEEEGSPTSRKQPPPKPRRDPSTKLSISSEAVDISPTYCKGDESERCDGTQGCSEDCRKVPPPKPKRNPNTQLSTSFDESYIRSNGSKGSTTMLFSRDGQTPSPQPQDLDEPVYIEMSGNVGQEATPRTEEDEPGEAVYEEMKYPALDEYDSRWDLVNCRSLCVTPCPSESEIYTPLSRCTTPRGVPLCDIPAPFPNLLSHRPPLLVFPPAPAQCSPNSDESPLTPLDVAKLPMFENGSFGKSPTSSSLEPSGSASTSHMRRAERELTATPTITASGRSSAPPLPCALYKSSSSSYSYQRSHSACPSPVSMGRCLTPLSLMRSPPIDGPFSASGLPRSASATPHGKASPPQDASSGGRHHGSMQNVSVARSRTPTSPLDELTNLFTTGRNMLKKNTSGRKSKEPGENESKGKSHSSESKREHKERSHHSKESKRDKDRSSKSSHRREGKDKEPNGTEASSRHDCRDCGFNTTDPLARRDSKDRGCNGPELPPRQESQDRGCSTEALPRRDSKDRGCNSAEPIIRRDSKDRSCSGAELTTRRDSKDRSSNGAEPIIRRDSKDRSCNGAEPITRRDSKDRSCNGAEPITRWDSKDRSSNGTDPIIRRDSKDRGCIGPELLARQDSKELLRNGLETRRDSREKACYGIELPPRHENKDLGRTGLESRRNSKEGSKHSTESVQDKEKSNHSAESWWGSKERISNGNDVRRECKDKGVRTSDPKDRSNCSTESPKAQDKRSGSSAMVASSWSAGRSSMSPNNVLGNSDLKMVLKEGRPSSTPVASSPKGTPQRQPPDVQQMPPMPWLCGDSTMLEMIEKKQRLCREIRSRQRLPDCSPCKKESLPIMPSWKKTNGLKKYSPPPYPTQTTVFWDTAI
ncbi:neuronal tyrosine-phosphorylated phosphoinositide-3-kinase adapter 2 isoform X1 [Danio rerio]|uniref:Neuronal tyrosine-phosphorylated phosphoinositide-3-kinase adapter 2 isoform X1 n=2 Tax=Danio rerio TaxID=7955 RepID=F1QW26_DANRE|nr:neuronal tyrosine-phosphorylated phosphoinositide-3-kinase adapter 2-like isoform X1 [Danio rerio]|eukprot:XP_003197868.2 neuronal tyrosine-phosphorylated phosphoinositide-3-kinase adapter 2-like isoform X1 [Danio rerio]